MTERADPDRPDCEDPCSWCGHELTRDQREGWEGRVCVGCYQKLAAAGIRDEEIFRESPPEQD